DLFLICLSPFFSISMTYPHQDVQILDPPKSLLYKLSRLKRIPHDFGNLIAGEWGIPLTKFIVAGSKRASPIAPSVAVKVQPLKDLGDY
ncbi:MAG: hypothetical protein WCD18_05995, partial [Thermosynechococcaceae cyanobacterium]